MHRYFNYILLLSMAVILSTNLDAQCSMCKAVVESGLDNSQTVVIGNGINKGIYFLMGIPYILLTVLAYTIYKNRKATEV